MHYVIAHMFTELLNGHPKKAEDACDQNGNDRITHAWASEPGELVEGSGKPVNSSGRKVSTGIPSFALYKSAVSPSIGKPLQCLDIVAFETPTSCARASQVSPLSARYCSIAFMYKCYNDET